MIKITGLSIPLDIIFPKNNIFVLLGTRGCREYVNGVVTENVTSYRYDVADPETFEKFSVRIVEAKPSISQEDIDDASGRINVSFENAVARIYRTQTGSYELSYKADSIFVVD